MRRPVSFVIKLYNKDVRFIEKIDGMLELRVDHAACCFRDGVRRPGPELRDVPVPDPRMRYRKLKWLPELPGSHYYLR